LKASLCAAAVAIVLGLIYYTPWQREVWVTTTPEAFAAMPPDPSEAASHPGMLPLGLTPAAWPEEAGQIYHAAELGKVVHVTLQTAAGQEKFDVIGLSKRGEVLVPLKSMSNASRLRKLLLSRSE